MKIIFESEEEKYRFFKGLYNCDVCPDDLGLNVNGCLDDEGCKHCFENYIPHEVIT